MTDTTPQREHRLRAIIDDAVFVIAGTDKLDAETIREVGERATWPESDTADDTAWWAEMTRSLVPTKIPLWLPMPDVIKAHTLLSGARGMRSLFTSKPSDKQVQGCRHIAATCTKMMTSVMASKTQLGAEQRRWRTNFVSAFGLPESDTEAILTETEAVVSHTESLPEAIKGKTAMAVGRGLWLTAFRQGLEPAQDDLVVALCQQLGLDAEKIEQGRQWAKQVVAQSKQPGAATVDAIRYVLADDESQARALARQVAHLSLPPVYLGESLSAIEHGGPIVLAQRHELSKQQRAVCLGISWLTAMRHDPTVTRCALLSERHDRIAEDLGNLAEGASVRRSIWQLLEDLLRQPLPSDA